MSKPEGSVLDCLFEAKDVKLNNIKFCRGTDRVIPEERFTDEADASLQRVLSGKLHSIDAPPQCRREALDLAALIADM